MASRPTAIPAKPFGAKPPRPRIISAGAAPLPGIRPTSRPIPMRRNTTIAATLSPASQASTSPKSRAASRFTPPSTTTMTRATTHCGTEGNQDTKMPAAPVISMPRTMMSIAQ